MNTLTSLKDLYKLQMFTGILILKKKTGSKFLVTAFLVQYYFPPKIHTFRLVYSSAFFLTYI